MPNAGSNKCGGIRWSDSPVVASAEKRVVRQNPTGRARQWLGGSRRSCVAYGRAGHRTYDAAPRQPSGDIMDRRSRTLWTLAILVVFPATQAISGESNRCSSSSVEYEIVEIGDGSPVAINDHGQLAGTMSLSDEVGRS